MGIHTWDSYVDYESKALKSYLEIIERFCSECHTNEDYDGCENCPTGKFVNQLKEYLLEIHESDILKGQAKIFQKIKKQIKKMPELHPLYLPVNEEHKFNSVFNKLKKLSFELDLWERCFDKKFEWKMHIADLKRLGEKLKNEKKMKRRKKKNAKEKRSRL